MNGLEAVKQIGVLADRIESLDRIIHYLDDDRDFIDDIYTLNDLLSELKQRRDELAAKLQSVQL